MFERQFLQSSVIWHECAQSFWSNRPGIVVCVCVCAARWMKEQSEQLTRRRRWKLWSVSFCNCKLAEFIVAVSQARYSIVRSVSAADAVVAASAVVVATAADAVNAPHHIAAATHHANCRLQRPTIRTSQTGWSDWSKRWVDRCRTKLTITKANI